VRKQQKTVLWPSYLDSSKTRKEGRKIPKSNGVPNPNILELQRAAEKLGLKPEAEADAAYPSSPWIKTGKVLVQKKGTKTQTVMKIAKEIVAIRQQTKK
jgi:signal recognition particle subunit SRP19